MQDRVYRVDATAPTRLARIRGFGFPVQKPLIKESKCVAVQLGDFLLHFPECAENWVLWDLLVEETLQNGYVCAKGLREAYFDLNGEWWIDATKALAWLDHQRRHGISGALLSTPRGRSRRKERFQRFADYMKLDSQGITNLPGVTLVVEYLEDEPNPEFPEKT